MNAIARDSLNLDYLSNGFAAALQSRDSVAAWDLNARYARLQPQSPFVPYNYGRVYLLRGDTAQAVAYYEKTIAIDPQNYQLCMDLAAYFARHNQPDKAAYYQKAAQKAANNSN